MSRISLDGIRIIIKLSKNLKILIAAGIYPPDVGGPAQYAKNLYEIWTSQGHTVSVKIFGKFRGYPWGIRHILFFLYVIPAVLSADYILTLDPFFAGILAILRKVFRKKVVFRTGGDFLWESYVERTGDKVLLRDFYKTRMNKFSLKEKIVFSLLRWGLQNVSAIIWSTEWQKEIFMEPYKLHKQKHFIVENYYGVKEPNLEPESKEFIATTRKLVWKNLDVVDRVFENIKKSNPEVKLFKDNLPFNDLMDKMKRSYAVILVSLGDISPNMILDSIRYHRPFICTREVGIYERIKDIGIFVDPFNEREIERAIIKLLDQEEYDKWRQRVTNFNFTHSWDEISHEIINIWKQV